MMLDNEKLDLINLWKAYYLIKVEINWYFLKFNIFFWIKYYFLLVLKVIWILKVKIIVNKVFIITLFKEGLNFCWIFYEI